MKTKFPLMKVIFFVIIFFMMKGVCAAFNYTGRHWDIRQVQYYVWNPPSETVINAHISSAQTWNNAGANFSFSYGGVAPIAWEPGSRDYKNVIGGVAGSQFLPGDVAITRCWISPSNVISECDIMINLTIPMSTSGDPNAMDLESVSLHEFGHFLKLNDLTNDPNSVMYDHLGLGQIKRVLDQDSKNGIRFIYGIR